MLNKHEWFWRVYAMSDDTKMLKDPSINDAERFIKKLEACEGIAAKLVLLRLFCDRYSAGQAAREAQMEATLAAERKDCEKALYTLAGAGFCTPAETYGTNTSWAISDLCRAVQELKRQLAEAREALTTISKSTCEYCLCKEIAEAALRQNEEK